MISITLAALWGSPALAGPHADQQATYGTLVQERIPVQRGPLPPPTPGPDMTVYGYLAYWDDDLNSVPWDDLSHLAVFNAEVDASGNLTQTGRWDQAASAVALGQPYGVDIHLCVTNFSPSSIETLLGSQSSRDKLIASLADWKASTGAQGINIDFEGLPSSRKQQMVDFTRDLQAAVGDVVLATPSVDWSGAWDYDELTKYADLFIMGYGYHYSGSVTAGPTDPLFNGAGTVWDGYNSKSLSWSLDDYLYWGADPDRVILGLPLYGYQWPTSNNSVPSATLGTGTSIFFAEAWAAGNTYGRSWEPDSLTPYTYDGDKQIWYGDVDSVQARIAYARDDAGVGGVGFWALHYDDDDPALWQMIHDETTWSNTEPTEPTTTDTGTPTTDPTTTTDTDTGTGATPSGDWIAQAGRPFIAYVGDVVQLSAEGSSGPPGVDLTYVWSQVSGPPVQIAGANTADPSFTIEEIGNLVFELVVGDGTDWSAPARSYVIVIDPDVGRRHSAGCGCGTGSLAGTWWMGLLALGATRRRSASAPLPRP